MAHKQEVLFIALRTTATACAAFAGAYLAGALYSGVQVNGWLWLGFVVAGTVFEMAARRVGRTRKRKAQPPQGD